MMDNRGPRVWLPSVAAMRPVARHQRAEESPMSTVIASIDVEVPVRTAYNQWTQFETFPQFMNGVESVRQIDDQHLHWETRVGGVHRAFDTEIIEQRPDDRIAWRSTDGDVRHSGVVLFSRVSDDASRV